MDKELVQREIRFTILAELEFRLHGQVADINGVADVLSEVVVNRLEALHEAEERNRTKELEELHKANEKFWNKILKGE